MKYEAKHKIKGKIIVKGTVTNKSNLLIGTGKAVQLDFEMIRDEDGKLFIPASSFVGMLSHHFKKYIEIEELDKQKLAHFWGTEIADEKNTSQSHLIVKDLLCVNVPSIANRDGVAIDPSNGIAKAQSKYDYELIEPGAEFDLYLEITIREGMDTELFKQILCFIIQEGEDGKYRQGAFTSHDFGRLKFSEIKTYFFDFEKAEDADLWFEFVTKQTFPDSISNLNVSETLTKRENNTVFLSGNFEIKNTLMIGGSDVNSLKNGLDKSHLKNTKGDPLLTSKSIRGAVRNRALKILNTIGNPNANALINNLFGFVESDNKKQKGRIIAEEVVIPTNDINDYQIQPRIKIDRFTGGTIGTALMSSQPLWHKNENFTLRFELDNPSESEIAILLLVMKDLMNEDLPIGGEKAIGRGVLVGKKLSLMKQKEHVFEITVNNDKTLDLQEKGDYSAINIEEWISNLKPKAICTQL